MYGLDLSLAGGAQLVLHLHGLDHHEPLGGLDAIPGLDHDFHDLAGHGRADVLGPGRPLGAHRGALQLLDPRVVEADAGAQARHVDEEIPFLAGLDVDGPRAILGEDPHRAVLERAHLDDALDAVDERAHPTVFEALELDLDLGAVLPESGGEFPHAGAEYTMRPLTFSEILEEKRVLVC